MKKVLVAASLLILATAMAESNFDKHIQAFAASQRIMEFLQHGQQVLDSSLPSEEYPKGKLSWSDFLHDFIKKAQTDNINSTRIDLLGKVLEKLNQSAKVKFENFDESVNEIMDIDLENNNDIIFVIAICIRLERFMDNSRDMFSSAALGARRKARAHLEDHRKKIVEVLRNRYQDQDLRALADDFLKLFPDSELLINRTPPANFSDCRTLSKEAASSFWMLDQYSAAAEFSAWGKNMLDYLLLDGNPMLIEEFKRQMKNYKNAFSTK